VEYYNLELCGLKRKLPIVSLGPKLKIASFNLLGDGELVGPEVKVVPLLQVLAKKLNKPRYIILRKNIMGYMTQPITNKSKPSLVLNGPDAKLLKGKKVIIIDDVVSTGRTIKVVQELMKMADAEAVGAVAVFKQGEKEEKIGIPFSFLGKLPLFQ